MIFPIVLHFVISTESDVLWCVGGPQAIDVTLQRNPVGDEIITHCIPKR